MSVEAQVIAALVDEGSPKKKLTEPRAAYLSGLFDGEGCVKFYMTIPRNRKSASPRRSLELSNSDYRIVKIFQYYFGGKISTYRSKANKPHYKVRISGRDSEYAAWVMVQHCISKKSQLEFYLQATAYLRYDRRHLDDESRQRLVEIAEEIRVRKYTEEGRLCL